MNNTSLLPNTADTKPTACNCDDCRCVECRCAGNAACACPSGTKRG